MSLIYQRLPCFSFWIFVLIVVGRGVKDKNFMLHYEVCWWKSSKLDKPPVFLRMFFFHLQLGLSQSELISCCWLCVHMHWSCYLVKGPVKLVWMEWFIGTITSTAPPSTVVKCRLYLNETQQLLFLEFSFNLFYIHKWTEQNIVVLT